MKALAIGGVEDHVHVLLSLPSTLSIAKAVQLLKGNSSKWIHQTSANQRLFEWQVGYGAFSCCLGLGRHNKVYSISERISRGSFLQRWIDLFSWSAWNSLWKMDAWL